MKEIDKNSRKLLNMGLEMSGAISANVFAMFMDPTGGLISGALGVVMTGGLKEVANRFLSNREEVRIGYSAVLSISNIQNRLKQGDKLRADDFFENRIYNRSKAAELFEGVLLKCKTEYEEEKIKYVSKIFENIVFNNDIDPENVNTVLNTVGQMTYKQIKLIAFVGKNKKNKFQVRANHYRGKEEEAADNSDFILQDLVTLDREALIERKDNTLIIHVSDIAPGGMVLTEIGELYYYLLGLDEMPEEEFDFLDLLCSKF